MNKKEYKKMKDILENTRRLKEDIGNNKQISYIETDNLEREFSIEVIASHFEQRLLNIDYNELKDFWSFITNEDVNLYNINRFLPIINNEMFRQYPNFKILDINKYFLNDVEIEYLINWYKQENGNKIKIKSIKKGYTKTLKIQDK